MAEETKKIQSDEEKGILKAIDDIENYPLTEDQQYLMNYLRANIDDVIDSMQF